MLFLFLQLIWLGLPAGLANIAPPIATKLFPKLSYPVDAYKTFRGKRIFGESKTIRGLIAGVLLGELTFLLQQALFAHTQVVSILSYNHLPWFFGFLFGIGALGGDLIKSFFKRQCNIPPSKTWIPFDQIDWILGTLILLLIFIPIPLQIIVLGIAIGIIAHIIVKFVGYLLGIDKQPI